MGHFRSLLLVSFAVIAFAKADGARAAGGVIEINQTSVQAGGISAGDTPGFPATLGQAGSYLLTSNLVVPANVDGIRVNVPDVAIDLAGFTIVGPGVPPSGTGIVASPQATNVRIRNGSVRGMDRGIFVGQDSRVEGIHAVGNLGDGIAIGLRSIATRNTAVGNGRVGIAASTSAIAKDNVTHDNTGDAFVTWLLFPFVSNTAGFDTGLAISNTTADPAGLGTANRSGTCVLTPFGPGAPAAFTTPTIQAGNTWSTNASIVLPGFQGYVIARCAFPLAHGYGFFSDNDSLSASTPALVIQPGRVQNLPEGLGQ
jgi:hypothetical protein